MRCTPIVTGLVLSSIVFATVSAQAQVSIDTDLRFHLILSSRAVAF